MKIATKFIGISALLVGAIALISGGGTLWRNQAEQVALNQYTQAQRRIVLATQAQFDLHNNISDLKDQVLFKAKHTDHEEQENSHFREVMQTLKASEAVPEIAAIERRYENFQQLEQQLIASLDQPSPTAIADNQQDFRAINGFNRDINFFLDRLIENAHQDVQKAEQTLERIRFLTSNASYATVLFLILIVLGEFWWVLRPILQSLKQLQEGATAIGAGNLSYRLNIHTQDEIEQVAQAFNQMAEDLTQAETTQKKLAEVEIARTAAEFANRSKSEFLANIITDVHMAVMDGLEMTRRLRQLPDFTSTPIIASPATLSQVDMQDSIDAGCTSFFPKPLEFNGLLAEIQRLLNLQWTYEALPAADPVTNGDAQEQSTKLLFPPPEELSALYTAAQSGFMSDVQQEAQRLKALAPKYIPLANHILELSQQFDDESIIRLLAPWV
jgi:CheY-like chemotaxis protein